MRLGERVVANAATIMAAAGSVTLSLVAIARTHIVNNDGARYLAAAEAFRGSGLEAAFRVYPWPYYSVLVAALMPLAGSALAAARLLDTVLLAIASSAFVLVVRELGADRPTQFVAAGLVVTHPGITQLRAVVVRDFGLWAFALLGLVALLRYLGRGRSSSAAAWIASGGAALLFRPDGAAVWAMSSVAPLVNPTQALRTRGGRFALIAGSAAAAVLAVLVLSFVGADIPTWLARLKWLLGETHATGFQSGARALADGFPYRHGREYAPYILFWGLLAILPAKIVRAIGLAPAVLAILGAASPPPPMAPSRRVIWLALVGTLLPLFIVLARRLFLETRYAVLSSLIVLLLAPFPLIRLLRSPAWTARITGVGLAAVIVVTWAWSLAVLPAPPSHLLAAARWLRENTPADARVHTNSPQIAYYSRRAVDWDEVEALLLGAPVAIRSGAADFFAITSAGDTPPPLPPQGASALVRVISFPGPQNDEVAVYRAERR